MIESRDDYIVVRTPDAPECFFSNMLDLQQRPLESDPNRLGHDFAHFVGTGLISTASYLVADFFVRRNYWECFPVRQLATLRYACQPFTLETNTGSF